MSDLGRRDDDLGEGMALGVENCGLVYKAIHKKEHMSCASQDEGGSAMPTVDQG